MIIETFIAAIILGISAVDVTSVWRGGAARATILGRLVEALISVANLAVTIVVLGLIACVVVVVGAGLLVLLAGALIVDLFIAGWRRLRSPFISITPHPGNN